jgi:hypothetical protein
MNLICYLDYKNKSMIRNKLHIMQKKKKKFFIEKVCGFFFFFFLIYIYIYIYIIMWYLIN